MRNGQTTTTRLVDRTNDCLESYFHSLKHGERRRSGRKVVTQDFERLPAAAALASIALTTPGRSIRISKELSRADEADRQGDQDGGAPVRLYHMGENVSVVASRRLKRFISWTPIDSGAHRGAGSFRTAWLRD